MIFQFSLVTHFISVAFSLLLLTLLNLIIELNRRNLPFLIRTEHLAIPIRKWRFTLDICLFSLSLFFRLLLDFQVLRLNLDDFSKGIWLVLLDSRFLIDFSYLQQVL